MTFKVVSFKGHEFKVVRGTTHPQYSYDSFDLEEVDIREKYWNVGPGQVVVDVGASYGSYTLTACAMGAKDVYSFEPEPTVFKDLVANLNLNGWFPRPCVPFPLGLWSHQATVSMKTYAPHWPQQTITGDYEMTTLDKVHEQAKFDRLDWVKIDVEGAEIPVLAGAYDTIREFHPKMLIECHTFLDKDVLEKVAALLVPMDYRLEEIDRPPCTTLFCR
jgi:FkbM family methyltransferase